MVAKELPVAARYHFTSRYRLRGGREAVWTALADLEQWPRWWSRLLSVEVNRAATGPDGVGASFTTRVRAPAGYRLSFTLDVARVDRLRRIDVVASGDLEGRGWLLLSAHAEDLVELSFLWAVSTPKRWMVVLAPVARPAFAWNHDRMMRDFGVGLAAVTGVELLRSSTSAVPPGSPGFQVFDG